MNVIFCCPVTFVSWNASQFRLISLSHLVSLRFLILSVWMEYFLFSDGLLIKAFPKQRFCYLKKKKTQKTKVWHFINIGLLRDSVYSTNIEWMPIVCQVLCLDTIPALLQAYILMYWKMLQNSLFFWLRHAACGILAPRPGIEPGPSAVRTQSPNNWTTREFPLISYRLLSRHPEDSGTLSALLKHLIIFFHDSQRTAGQLL